MLLQKDIVSILIMKMRSRNYLIDTITNENKEGLHLIHFPHIRIDFDKIFDGIE